MSSEGRIGIPSSLQPRPLHRVWEVRSACLAKSGDPPLEGEAKKRAGSESRPERLRSRRCGGVEFGVGSERSATVNDFDLALLGLDHQPLEDAGPGEGDEVAWIEREHLIIAPEARTLT